MKITSLKAIEILDSRGNPTIRTFVELEDGSVHSSSVPSGTSTGKYEARELRDEDQARYEGKGVLNAVKNVNTLLNQALTGMDVLNPDLIDKKILELDGTENKEKLGANVALSVSQAVLKTASCSQHIPLWKFLNQYYFNDMNPAFPRLMVNIVNGGKHANWNFDIQEFMIVPKQNMPSQSVKTASEIFHSLGKILQSKGLSILVGDEGGYSPALSGNEEVLGTIISSAQTINYELLTHYDLSLDCAASEWIRDGAYVSHKTRINITSDELINYYLKLQEQYKILSFEDPFSEDDWQSFQKFTQSALTPTSPNTFIVGDDLFVTNPKRIQKGIEEKLANAVLIKPNQIGTILETVEAIKLAKNAGWKIVISHRSGETEDPFIADLAYGVGADFIKAGSMSRSERLAKYNRLLEIENGL